MLTKTRYKRLQNTYSLSTTVGGLCLIAVLFGARNPVVGWVLAACLAAGVHAWWVLREDAQAALLRRQDRDFAERQLLYNIKEREYREAHAEERRLERNAKARARYAARKNKTT